MKYFRKIEGEKVYLSPMNIEDVEKYVEWLNNPNITQYLSIHNKMVDLISETEFIEKNSKEEFLLAIIRSSDNVLLGNIRLSDIDYKSGTATLGIFIGEEENLSKGYGSEAIKLILSYAFNELRLHNIMLNVYDMNERAKKAYQKCGFKEFGRRHGARYHDGKYSDIICMEIVNDKI